ncbi:hypothetical protein BDV34DRAFT_122763 [Aspergillus parasiticus]|uniref:Uncharacterized protein n=1 Tax=Aspergillus parasiticus TaxID=5067 RepID=A0A5N6DGH9_ASPPA|nr:hypothetical protein BDV34DRAFT_122763 [Aspergillus parasiticus]
MWDLIGVGSYFHGGRWRRWSPIPGFHSARNPIIMECCPKPRLPEEASKSPRLGSPCHPALTQPHSLSLVVTMKLRLFVEINFAGAMGGFEPVPTGCYVYRPC